jgi:cytochrome b561
MPAMDDRYNRVAVVLHWAIGLALLAQIVLGWSMIEIPKNPVGVRAFWFNLHKSIGITIGLLVFVRIAWRLAHAAPDLPANLPLWQRRAARASHVLLYVCMAAMPLTGYFGSSFSNYPIKYFGVPLPQWGWDAPALKATFSAIHLGVACVFIALIVVHATAALRHLLARDGVFNRMWPLRFGSERSVSSAASGPPT